MDNAIAAAVDRWAAAKNARDLAKLAEQDRQRTFEEAREDLVRAVAQHFSELRDNLPPDVLTAALRQARIIS